VVEVSAKRLRGMAMDSHCRYIWAFPRPARGRSDSVTQASPMSGISSSPRTRAALPWVVFASTFVVLTAGALVFTVGTGLGTGAHAFHGTTYDDPDPAPAFTLTDHQGQPARLSDFQGEAVLLFFGFTHCPDVCPLTLNRLTQVLEGMGTRGEQVRVLLVTVDPERDTPEMLARYVERFGPRVTGMTGDQGELAAIRKEYGVYAAEMPDHSGHMMTVHTPAVFGIDRGGRLRVLIHPDAPEAELQADIRALLRS
jgi:protein SCO1